MNIVIHDYGRYAFIAQLSRELARRGHTVQHWYAGYNNTPLGNMERQPDDPPGYQPQAIYTRQPLEKYKFLKRFVQELEYGGMVAGRLKQLRPDVLISANAPLEVQRSLYAVAQKQGTAVYYWLQDMLGVASHLVLRQKLPVIGEVVGRYHRWLERRMLTGSQGVISIAPQFSPLLDGWGIPAGRQVVIPNWAPLEHYPQRPKDNPWSRARGRQATRNLVYTGSLGLKHNPQLLCILAQALRSQPDARVVVISEGLGANWLAEQKLSQQLENLILLPYQDFACMPDVLASADVLLAVLEPAAGEYSSPSKILAYLCAGKPVLLAAPAGNQSAQLITGAKAGVIADPQDERGWVAAALKLIQDGEGRQAMGVNGRQYAERQFDIRRIGDHFEAFIQATMRMGD